MNKIKRLGLTFILAADLLSGCSDANTNKRTLEQRITPEFIDAVIQVESSGNPKAERYEAHINDTSYGLMQILTRTALDISKEHPELPSLDLNSDGKITKSEIKTSLINPKTNRQYGTALLKDEFEKYGTLELAVAAYNAGSNTPRNALIQHQLNSIYGTHLDEDGIIGKLSKQVVIKFQKENGLKSNGKIGETTQEKLNEVYKKRFPNQTLPKGLIPQNKYTPNHVRKVMSRYRN